MGNGLKIHSMIEYLIFVENLGCYAMEAENPRLARSSETVRPNDLKISQNHLLIKAKKQY